MILKSALKKIAIKVVSAKASNHLNRLGKGFNCSLDKVLYIMVKCFKTINNGIIYIYFRCKILEKLMLTR